jgi:hypothetical protein
MISKPVHFSSLPDPNFSPHWRYNLSKLSAVLPQGDYHAAWSIFYQFSGKGYQGFKGFL